jgi:hypothetical protein
MGDEENEAGGEEMRRSCTIRVGVAQKAVVQRIEKSDFYLVSSFEDTIKSVRAMRHRT